MDEVSQGVLEARVAALEGGSAALAVASGHAAQMLVMHAVISQGIAAGFDACEASWILEDNRDMLGPLETLGHVPYRRYRIDTKPLR